MNFTLSLQISQFLCSHPLHRIHGMDTGLMDFGKKHVGFQIKLVQIVLELKWVSHACDQSNRLFFQGFTLTDPLLSNREWYLWGYDGQPNGMSDGLGTSNCIANRVNIHDGGGIDDIP